jgi:hypothetical protein
MKTLKVLSLAFATASALTLSVHAVSITGNIQMSGTATLDNTALGSASAASGFTAVTVAGTPTGSFTGTGGDSVTWTGFNWPSSTTVPLLWSFSDVGTGATYSFDLNNVHVVAQDNFFLNLRGEGVLRITGGTTSYDDTTGSWSFTVTNDTGTTHDNFQFGFSNSQTAVPDGGATIALLGVGLLGLGTLRRKI